MSTHLALVNTEHQGVENCRRQVIIVDLIALVRWLRLVAEHEKVPIRLRGQALIEE
jgi:hypothetical protein